MLLPRRKQQEQRLCSRVENTPKNTESKRPRLLTALALFWTPPTTSRDQFDHNAPPLTSRSRAATGEAGWRRRRTAVCRCRKRCKKLHRRPRAAAGSDHCSHRCLFRQIREEKVLNGAPVKRRCELRFRRAQRAKEQRRRPWKNQSEPEAERKNEKRFVESSRSLVCFLEPEKTKNTNN